jgi:hypothetical protein
VEPEARELGVGSGADPHAAWAIASNTDTRSLIRRVLLTR